MNTPADPMESKDPLNSIPEEGKSEGASDSNDKSVEPEGGDVGKNLKEGTASVISKSQKLASNRPKMMWLLAVKRCIQPQVLHKMLKRLL